MNEKQRSVWEKPPEDQSPIGGDLWFKELLKDPDWLRDPAGKAGQVAHQAVDELLKIRG